MVEAGERAWVDLQLRRLIVATASVAAGLAFALFVTAWSWQVPQRNWWSLDVPLHTFGVVSILIGYVAWVRLPESRTGLLIVCLGTTYYLQDLRASSNIAIFGLGVSLAYAWTAVVAHLILAWPTGRVTGRGNRTLLLGCYASAIATQALRLVFDHRPRPWLPGMQFERTPASMAGSISAIVFTLVVVVVTVRRWLAASGVRRQSRAPVWAALLLLAIPSAAAILVNFVDASVPVMDALLLVALGTGVFLVPAVLIAQSTNTMRARWRLARVILDRDRAGDLKLRPELLQQALADALGDPVLRVAYPLGDGRFVDVDGRQTLPAVGSAGRAVTRVDQAGELVALIEHDETLGERQQVAATVAEVAGIAIENARMHARLSAQIEEIKNSRFRVSAAATKERRLIQRNLHDGAQQQFFAVLTLLGLAKHQLDARAREETSHARDLVQRAHGQLQKAIESLRELTEGIYPATLMEYGLAAAIEGIADTSPVPIEVDIPRTRWPEHVETTAYFLVAEAIANTYKHAQASQVIVHVRELDRQVWVEVADDGRGGATLRPGHGSGGMLDRVNTIGGSLTVSSEPGEGTAIRATLPVEMTLS